MTLTLESPLLVGNKKLNNNYVKSLGYIPGSVLRAALAVAVTQACQANGKSDKAHWVQWQNEEVCQECPHESLCRSFDKIQASHFYPAGARIHPLTAMRCKYDASHPVVDTLPEFLATMTGFLDNNRFRQDTCSVCGERLEKCSGFRFLQNPLILSTRLIMKNGIDPYRKTARDGYLYGLDVLNETAFTDKGKIPTTMTGQLELPSELGISALDGLDVLRVGAKITAGFGKCSVTTKNASEEQAVPIMERINKLNSLVNGSREEPLIVLTLGSDAYLNLEGVFEEGTSPAAMDTDTYYQGYEKALHKWVPESLSLKLVIARHDMRRGFDTSQKANYLRKLKLVTQAGSVFVFTGQLNDNLITQLEIMESKGLGEQTVHGFGQVSVCDPVHLEFINQS